MTQTGSRPKVAVVGGGIAGVAAAWSLDRSGFPVELFEKAPALGGNAKTWQWQLAGGQAESPLLVIAWPEKYYHNYHALLAELDLERTRLPITYFVQHPDGIFCQDGETELHRRLAPQFARWDRLIRFCERINDVLLPKSPHDSLYRFSYANPLNLIPLYRLARMFGVSEEFWQKIFVTVHCASMITTSMKDAPAVIAPLLESIVPLEQACEMGTWAGSPRAVFERMTAPFGDAVHTACEIVAVQRDGSGFRLESREGGEFRADRVVFACQAPAVLAAL
jgi:predicted NAD/FAD-binding protein